MSHSVATAGQGESAGDLVRRYVPIAGWLPGYDRSWLRWDVIAAFTVWALLVPEAMAYATLAGMPPETGLWAAPLALLGYAIFGTSRQLSVGPSSTVAVLSAVVVGMLVAGDPERWVAMSAALAIVTGVILIVGGLLKMGVLANFMSKPVLGGFVVGLAVTIAVGQLDKLLGYQVPAGGFFEEIIALIRDLGSIHWATFTVGMISLALLFLIDRHLPKVPGALTVVALSIVAVSIFGLEAAGVHIIGDIPAGLPPIGLPGGITVGDMFGLLFGGVAIGLVAFAESVAAARQYATKYGYEIDADQELIALGVANVGSGLSSGFVVDGSLSRTAAADDAGTKTQLASIINAVIVLITAAALTPLFHNLAEATLGAIVIHAVWHLIDFHKLRRYYGISRTDFAAALTALLGVLLFGILLGLVVAIFVSLLGLLRRASNPRTAILGRMPDEEVFRDVARHPEAKTYPGLVIFRFDEMLFFANVSKLREKVRAAVAGADTKPDVVLIDAESISEVDITAIDTLGELSDELEQEGIDLWFARVKEAVLERMGRSSLESKIGHEHFYASVRAGLDAYLARPPEVDESRGESSGGEGAGAQGCGDESSGDEGA